MVQGNRMSMADPGARPPRKASQLVHGNGMGMGDLESQVVRKALVGQARLPSKEVSLTPTEDLHQSQRSISRSSWRSISSLPRKAYLGGDLSRRYIAVLDVGYPTMPLHLPDGSAFKAFVASSLEA